MKAIVHHGSADVLRCEDVPKPTRPLMACRRVLTSRGMYVAVGVRPGNLWIGPLSRVLRAPVVSWFVRQKLVLFMARIKSNDLIALKEPIEVGRTPPVIDRRYALREVPEATRYLKEGHARGKVVITVGSRAQA